MGQRGPVVWIALFGVGSLVLGSGVPQGARPTRLHFGSYEAAEECAVFRAVGRRLKISHEEQARRLHMTGEALTSAKGRLVKCGAGFGILGDDQALAEQCGPAYKQWLDHAAEYSAVEWELDQMLAQLDEVDGYTHRRCSKALPSIALAPLRADAH